jgi:hypothetical protein
MVRRENLRRVLIVGPLETPLPFQFRTHGAWGEPTTGIFVKSFLMIYSWNFDPHETSAKLSIVSGFGHPERKNY